MSVAYERPKTTKIFVVDNGKRLLYRVGILYQVNFVTFIYRVEKISKAH